MTIKSHIQQITQRAKELFCEPTELMFRDKVQQENRLARQYRGREIFELLQNIDDAFDSVSSKPHIANFRLNGQWLEVSNNGKPFTIDTLIRLCQGNVSGKHGEYIGCKGIGFRSVLNWSDEIEIYSGEGAQCISVGFSREFADKQFQQIKDQPHIIKQISELKQRGLNVMYPIFKAPRYLEPINKDFDTVIRIKIKDEKLIEDIRRDIDTFNNTVILFLPHIERIEFSYGSDNICITKERTAADVYCVNESRLNNVTESISYYFGERRSALEHEYEGSKTIKMAIAIPVDEARAADYCMYTFFPILGVKAPFPALLHATFCLTDNRNDLDLSSPETKQVNRTVLTDLLTFYADFVTTHIAGLRRIRLLMPSNAPKSCSDKLIFGGNLGLLGCESSYVKHCASLPVLLSIDGTYLTPSTSTPIILEDYPQSFNGEDFSEITLPIADERLREFAERLILTDRQRAYSPAAILHQCINAKSGTWSAETRVGVFKWWCTKRYKSLPNLLKKQGGKFITSSTEPCFLSGSIVNLPEWANISVIDKDDEDQLLKVYADEIAKDKEVSGKNEQSKRILPRLINREIINMQEQSSKSVMISPVNSSVNNDYSRAVEFITWLWEIWREEHFDETIKKNIHFNLPAADHTVSTGSSLYIGKDYGNDIGASIFCHIDGYKPLALVDFNIEQTERKNLEYFLNDMRVSKYPRLTTVYRKSLYNAYGDGDHDSEAPVIWSYIERLKLTHKIDYNVTYYVVSLQSIKNIHQILRDVPFADIMAWLTKTTALRQKLAEIYEPTTSQIEYKPRIPGQKYTWTYNDTWSLPSYLRYVFSITPWIEIDSIKYKPEQLVMSDDDFVQKLGVDCLTERKIDELASEYRCDREMLRSLFISAGVRETLLDLPAERFYGLLLKISALTDADDIYRSKKLSREIYRLIIDNNRNGVQRRTAFFADCEAKTEFFANGRVLAKSHHGVSVYKPLDKVFFSSSAVLNLNDSYLIDIPTRSGQKDDFREILNIKTYELDYRVVDVKKAPCNEAFVNDFVAFLPYLMTYRKGKKDEVCNLCIDLVSEAAIEVDGNLHTFNEMYGLLKKSKSQWYIYVGEAQIYAQLEKEKLADNLEQIFNVFFNYPSREFLSKVVQLFICSQRQREYFVRCDFGSLEEYDLTKKEIKDSATIRQSIKERIYADYPGADCDSIIDNIDWLDTSSAETQRHIAELLTRLSCTPDYLSAITGKGISLNKYNFARLSAAFRQREEHFKRDVYCALYTKKERWKDLRQLWASFSLDDCSDINIDTLDFSPDQAIEALIDKCFKTQNIARRTDITDIPDYKSIYNDNLKSLQEIDPDAEFIVDYTNQAAESSLMFFETPDQTKLRFIEFKEKASAESVASDNNIDDINRLLSNTVVDNHIVSGALRESIRTGSGTTVSDRQTGKTSRKQKRQGALAEYLVVLKLVDRNIAEVIEYLGPDYDIKWVSGAAKRIQEIESDATKYDKSVTSDKLGYDIKLTSKSGDRCLYLEVKSSSADECSFMMSRNEYDFAQKVEALADERYRIVFVSGIDINNEESKPKISYIDRSVAKDPSFKKRATEYNIAYQEQNLQDEDKSKKKL